MVFKSFSINIKGNVGVISIGLLVKEGHPRFTTVPFKLLIYLGRQNFPDLFKETLEIIEHFVCYIRRIEFTQCASVHYNFTDSYTVFKRYIH